MRPSLTPQTFASVFKDMIWLRDEFDPSQKSVIKMDQFWEWFVEELDPIITSRELSHSQFSGDECARVSIRGAGYVLEHDPEFFKKLRMGQRLQSFQLAHEVTHLVRGHLEMGDYKSLAFSMPEVKGMNSAVGLNNTELEAHYGAVFLQCGRAILDSSINAKELAISASSDFYRVERAQKICQQDLVKRHIAYSMRLKKVVL